MRTEDTKCALQRLVTSSEYDHVGMLIKFGNNQVKIFESNADEGVSIYDWDKFHTQFNQYNTVCFRRLHYNNK